MNITKSLKRKLIISVTSVFLFAALIPITALAAKSSNAYVRGMSITVGTLNKSFNKSMYKGYVITLPYNESSTKISVSRAHKGSKVSAQVGKNKWTKAVKKDVTKRIPLEQGKSVIVRFRIISENKKVKKTYTCKVKRDVKKYSLTVIGGTGGGIYAAGTPVSIKAIIPIDKDFVEWSDGTTTADFTYTMPAKATTLSATFKDKEDKPKYSLTIIGGSGGGEYEAGAKVTVTALIPTGKQFVNWTPVNVDTPSFIYTMPAAPITLTANFREEGTTWHEAEYEDVWVPESSATVTANDINNGTVPTGYKIVTLYADYCLTCYQKNILVITACARYENGLVFTGNEKYITGGIAWGDAEYAAHMSEHMNAGEAGQGFTGNIWLLENISSGEIAGFWRENGGVIDATKITVVNVDGYWDHVLIREAGWY